MAALTRSTRRKGLRLRFAEELESISKSITGKAQKKLRSRRGKRVKVQRGITPRTSYLSLPRELRLVILKDALAITFEEHLPDHLACDYYCECGGEDWWHKAGVHASLIDASQTWKSLASITHPEHLEDLRFFLQPLLKIARNHYDKWLGLWEKTGGHTMCHLGDREQVIRVWYRYPNRSLVPPEEKGLVRHLTYAWELAFLCRSLEEIAFCLGVSRDRRETWRLRALTNLDGMSPCWYEYDDVIGKKVYCLNHSHAQAWCSVWS